MPCELPFLTHDSPIDQNPVEALRLLHWLRKGRGVTNVRGIEDEQIRVESRGHETSVQCVEADCRCGETRHLAHSLLEGKKTTLDHMVAYRCRRPTGACVLAQPRHVLLFTREGREIEVLNRFFDLGLGEADRACRALFRAYPDVRRVRLEVTGPPDELSFPWSLEEEATFMEIDLPSSVDEYYRSLLSSYTPEEVRAQLTRAGLVALNVERVTDRHFDVWGRLD